MYINCLFFSPEYVNISHSVLSTLYRQNVYVYVYLKDKRVTCLYIRQESSLSIYSCSVYVVTSSLHSCRIPGNNKEEVLYYNSPEKLQNAHALSSLLQLQNKTSPPESAHKTFFGLSFAHKSDVCYNQCLPSSQTAMCIHVRSYYGEYFLGATQCGSFSPVCGSGAS